jgi:hypothetical protein
MNSSIRPSVLQLSMVARRAMRWFALPGLLAAAGVGAAQLQPLSESELAEVSGTGIAVALDNFRYMMAPTSYMEQVGVTPSGACTGSGSVPSNTNCWRRGDLRWYGINLSGASSIVGSGSHWNESACNPGLSSMNCPRGGMIINFAPFDNPYVMRSWSPIGMAYDGSMINTDPSNPTKTIYEYLAPTRQPDYIMSFWGEIEVGATRNPALQPLSVNGGSLLKSQTIIRGNAAGSVFRIFKYTELGPNPEYGETFAMYYHSRLKGDFRFSVAQSAELNSDAAGVPVVFADVEGLHFRNVNAFLPLGQAYYQALVLNAEGTSGNFSLKLTQVPNNQNVYSRFYGLNAGDDLGYETARWHLNNTADCGSNLNCQNYRMSHGYVRYGDWYPGSVNGLRNSPTSTASGIFFRACPDCAPFIAYAERPFPIDKRGEHFGRGRTQQYNCATNNGGNCIVNSSGGVMIGANTAGQRPRYWDGVSWVEARLRTSSRPETCRYDGSTDHNCWTQQGNDIAVPVRDPSRTLAARTVNLGDARMEGLLINRLEFISCQSGGC